MKMVIYQNEQWDLVMIGIIYQGYGCCWYINSNLKGCKKMRLKAWILWAFFQNIQTDKWFQTSF